MKSKHHIGTLKAVRYLLLFLALIEYWLMILTASRTSWIALMAGLTIGFALLLFKKKPLWVIPRWLTVSLTFVLIMMAFGDLSERFSHIFKLEGIKHFITQPFRSPPQDGMPLAENLTPEQQLSIVATRTDIPPLPAGDKTRQKPADVYFDPYPEIQAYLATISGQTINVDYSANALKYGLSAGIRLDVLWPNAVKAFKRNPLLGTGYSTLVKSKVWQFTTAESTDNDYLRLLGETGLLGFVSFMAIFVVILLLLWRPFKQTTNSLHYGLYGAGIALTIGLMINALYIDVFEASKIAYSYWSIIGLILALAVYELKPDKKT